MATPDLEHEKDSKILRTGYQAYLLRCWLEEIGASLEEVTAYLRDTLAARKNI